MVYKTTDMAMGDILHSIRKELNISQEDLARISGLSKNTVGGYERGIISFNLFYNVEALLNSLGYELAVIKKDDLK